MSKITRLAMLFSAIVYLMPDAVWAKIHSEVVDYQIDGKAFQGYLSYDTTLSGKRPGVLVAHEWWGHNAYARKRADMLARLGYTAFALDIYGAGNLAEHPENAKKFMQQVLSDIKVAETRFQEGIRILKNQPNVNENKIAAIGYCFGGGLVLHMARIGTELAGVVSFHGSLAAITHAQPGQIKARILVLNGGDDPFVPAELISTFKQEMKSAKANMEFVNYPGVKHSFTNPEADIYSKNFNMPLAYDQSADKDSWQRMQKFLKAVFDQ